uniref:Uncharacterized protein n=1 Tax=Utricularia reniformis TaxID=192314 RepID=A0A1Y0B358_9LAMI|nr:hypothetical protein AEK19_MT1657 [Utricularia reniformis]ART31841.1 hypothetical protein AEK19_MT1657 [Utricularia reniformis]
MVVWLAAPVNLIQKEKPSRPKIRPLFCKSFQHWLIPHDFYLCA